MLKSNIFLDTNIVLDIIDSSRVNHPLAKELWKLLVLNECEIMISEDILSTIYYINKRKKESLLFFQLIQKRWNIVPFGKDVIKNAIGVSLKENVDLEDVLQCLCAQENGCHMLITNDTGFYDCGVSICSITEFLDMP